MITLYNYLNLKELDIQLSDKFEPGKDDIEFLVETAKKVPRTPEEIDNLEASHLASICLIAFQRCIELHTRSTMWAGYKKIDLDAQYGTLISASNRPATLAKEISKSDEDYKKAAREFEKAKAYVEFYSGLMSEFEKGHYWAKSKEITNNKENGASSYEAYSDAAGSKKKGVNEEKIETGESSKPDNFRQTKQIVEDVDFL